MIPNLDKSLWAKSMWNDDWPWEKSIISFKSILIIKSNVHNALGECLVIALWYLWRWIFWKALTCYDWWVFFKDRINDTNDWSINMTHVHKNVVKTKAVIFINLNNVPSVFFGVLNKERKGQAICCLSKLISCGFFYSIWLLRHIDTV
jgi:hypothetical protein